MVKQSKKTASWFLAIAKDDEEALRALELLRKRGCFNTRLWKWDKRDEMQLIRRWYIYPKQPAIEIQRRRLYGMMDLDEQQLAETLDYHQDQRARWIEESRKKDKTILRLQDKIAKLEADMAELRTECMIEDGLYNNEDVEEILKSSHYGTWIKTANADEHPKLHTPNLNFVAPDMSATLGMGPHVLIDIEKVPKDLQVLLAKMMDELNNHTLRLTQLENC